MPASPMAEEDPSPLNFGLAQTANGPQTSSSQPALSAAPAPFSFTAFPTLQQGSGASVPAFSFGALASAPAAADSAPKQGFGAVGSGASQQPAAGALNLGSKFNLSSFPGSAPGFAFNAPAAVNSLFGSAAGNSSAAAASGAPALPFMFGAPAAAAAPGPNLASSFSAGFGTNTAPALGQPNSQIAAFHNFPQPPQQPQQPQQMGQSSVPNGFNFGAQPALQPSNLGEHG